jgi:hypothetical protein
LIPRYPSFFPETSPAVIHHRWRAASSAAAFTKFPPTVVGGTLLRIALRAKPAVLAATATHRRLTTLRFRVTTESALSTATSGIAL